MHILVVVRGGKGRIDGMWGDDNDGNFVSYSHTQELWHAKNFN